MDTFRSSTRIRGLYSPRNGFVRSLPPFLASIMEPNVPSRHLFPLFTEFLRANTYELWASSANIELVALAHPEEKNSWGRIF